MGKGNGSKGEQPITFSENLLQFVSLLPEVTTLHNWGSKVISFLGYICFAHSLDKMGKFTYEILKFITMLFFSPFKSRPFCVLQSNQAPEVASLLFVAFNYSYSFADKHTGSMILGCFSSESVNCSPELDLNDHHLPQNGNQPLKGEPGHRDDATGLGRHLDTNSHTCRLLLKNKTISLQYF